MWIKKQSYQLKKKLQRKLDKEQQQFDKNIGSGWITFIKDIERYRKDNNNE